MRIPLFILIVLTSPLLQAQEGVDLAVVHQIKREALERSQVMDHLFYLVDVHGNRLTGSPGFQGAADWAVRQLREWGMENIKQERWGPFGQGWSTTLFSAHLMEPGYETLIGVPLAWSPDTDGVLSGEPMLAPLERQPTLKRDRKAIDEFIEKYRGKLEDRLVLIAPLKDVKVRDRPLSRRFDASELAERATEPEGRVPIDFDDPELEIPTQPERRRDFFAQAPRWFREQYNNDRQQVRNRLNQFLVEEGVRLVIHPARQGDGGTVFPPRAGSHKLENIAPPPSIALTPEQYNRIFRLLEKEIPVRIEVEVRAQFHRDSLDSLNVIAELPGGSKSDEIVMIGAHLDSVGAGLGATDNAAGCAVMMEALRILKTLDLKLDRTVRLALWGGEEEGLLGSKAYVKEHFGDPETMELKAEHATLAAYFNFDNGTGKIRGVYLQGNDMVRPIFRTWLAPFQDMGATSLSIRNTGGTDHLSFDAVGLPGFQFIQDPVEYQTRSHHSNMDLYDRVQSGDLMQASAIIASFVYHAANLEDKLPRKPLPEPQPTVKEQYLPSN